MKNQKSMLAEFVIKKVEHEKENSNSKPLPGKKLILENMRKSLVLG